MLKIHLRDSYLQNTIKIRGVPGRWPEHLMNEYLKKHLRDNNLQNTIVKMNE